jgi:NADH-quinone oxidoreductase subunit H
MNWPRALALFAVAFLATGLLAVAGPWVPPAGPALVEVLGLTPTDVEPGDRIVITGEGFPAGKQARVRFGGTLYRSGEKPLRGAEVLLTGTVAGPEQIEIDFREAEQALFCGAGDRAAHTTFEGEVEVAFAAASPGAAPVAGLLRHAVLDVRPSASPVDRAHEADGERVLQYMGLRVTPPSRRGLGLTVEAVQPGSPADVAGVVAGDVVMTFDSVRAATGGDLVPVPGEREATVGIRSRGATTDTPRPVSVESLRRAPPAELVDAALVVAGALGILLLLGFPVPPPMATALQRAASRLRAGPILGAALREALPPLAAPALVDAAMAALLAVMPFGQYLVAARMDVELLFFAAVTFLAVVTVVAAGPTRLGLRAAAHVAWQHVPAALSVASIVLTTGSLRLQEIVRAQGTCPWDWLAFRSPAAVVLLGLLLGAARIGPDEKSPPEPIAALVDAAASHSGDAAASHSGDAAASHSGDASASRSGPRGRWLAALLRAHRFLIAGLASTLFLGGWSLPGLSPEQQEGRLLLEGIGAAWLVGKTWALALGLGVLRRALPAERLADGSRTAARWELPLAIAALGWTAAWTRWSPEGGVQPLVSGSLVAIAALVAMAIVQRLRHAVLSPGGDGHLSPFL